MVDFFNDSLNEIYSDVKSIYEETNIELGKDIIEKIVKIAL